MSDQAPWTCESLFAHFTTRLDDTAKRVEAQLSDLQGQLDRRIKTQQDERRDTERHLEALIQATREEMHQALAGIKDRLELLNRLREAVETDRLKFMTRDEIDARLGAHERRIDKTERDLDRRAGSETALDRRRQQIQPWHLAVMGAAVTVITTTVAVLANVLTG